MRMNDYMMWGTYMYPFGSSDLIYIFSGSMPEVDENFIFALANYADQQLAAFTPINQLRISTPPILEFSSSPASISAIATKTGTAAWFAIVDQSYRDVAIIGTLTDNVQNTDVLLMETVSVIEGQSAILIDLRIDLMGNV